MTSTTHSKPTILVTSAAGHTGAPAVRHLRERGFPVRAFVRRDDARAAALRQLGADVRVGNLLDIRDLREALIGVDRAYYCPPFGPNLLHSAAAFAIAAEEAGLEAVAWMGAWNRHESHPSIHSREHWLIRQLLRGMTQIPSIHIEPGLFAFTYFMGLPFVKHLGLLALPFGAGANAPPSNEDIGRVAAQTLIEPGLHIGKTYRPTGPELLSGDDCAEIMGQVLGRRVRYQPVNIRQFIKAALALGHPPFEVSQIRFFAEDARRGAFAVGGPTDHVEAVLGKKSDDFAQITKRLVADPDRVVRGLRAGSRLGAWWLVLKMLATRVPDFPAWEAERGHPRITAAGPCVANPSWIRERASLGSASRIDGGGAAPAMVPSG